MRGGETAVQDQDAIYTQLEERLERLAQVVTRLKARNAELEKSASALTAERDSALAQLSQAQTELAEVRTRNKDAASRVKNLLTQIEQMDLLSEG